MRRTISFLIFGLLIAASLSGQTWSTWNGKTAGSATGNVSTLDGKTVGTATGNYNKWNNLSAASGGPTPAYTGQTCQGGQNANPNVTTQACSASMTVTTGNVIVLIGTLGGSGASTSLTSCSHTGTASVTWTVVAAMLKYDSVNGQEIFGCWGNITAGGTVTPSANWATLNGFSAVIAAEFSGVIATTDNANSLQNTGSTATNGNKSGTITTTTNNDLLVGGIVDTNGTAATVTAGTASVTFTKIGACNDASSARVCLEWGVQSTAGASTEADWTLSNTDRTVANILAVKP